MKGRVLIVGGDLKFRESIRRVLRFSGYEVETAVVDGQAMIHFGPWRIDLVILDFESGSRTIRQLKERLGVGGWRCSLLLLVRSHEQLAMASDTITGMVLLKPIDLTRIMTVLDYLLAERRLPVLARQATPDHTAAVSAVPCLPPERRETRIRPLEAIPGRSRYRRAARMPGRLGFVGNQQQAVQDEPHGILGGLKTLRAPPDGGGGGTPIFRFKLSCCPAR